MNIRFTKKTLMFSFLFLMTTLYTCQAQKYWWSERDSWQKVSEIFKAMDIKEGSWVADVGAEEGYLTLRLAPAVGKRGRIFSVDIDSKSLGELHNNLKEKKIENVTVVYSVPDNPMLPEESMDAVVIINAYHEMADYKSMLNHIKKALKPNGRLVLVEPISENRINASRGEQATKHEISLRLARKDLQDAGFEIIDSQDPFTTNPHHDRMWLLAGRRPKTGVKN